MKIETFKVAGGKAETTTMAAAQAASRLLGVDPDKIEKVKEPFPCQHCSRVAGQAVYHEAPLCPDP